jgi:CRP-like cAMP-binding protein
LKSLIQKIFYFKDLKKDELHEIMYNLRQVHLEPGEYCLLDNNGSKADEIIFVESGTLEVLTYMEGNEFVIDYLTQGSIINYRSILV